MLSNMRIVPRCCLGVYTREKLYFTDVIGWEFVLHFLNTPMYFAIYLCIYIYLFFFYIKNESSTQGVGLNRPVQGFGSFYSSCYLKIRVGRGKLRSFVSRA